MNLKRLSGWMKGIVAALFLFGALFFFVFIPLAGLDFVRNTAWYWAWVALLWLIALPCAYILCLCWRASCDVSEGKAFTQRNATRLKGISVACFINAALLLLGNALLLILQGNNVKAFLISLFVVGGFAIVATAAACLSAFVQEAAKIKEENDSFV